jgi:hypothetical protein
LPVQKVEWQTWARPGEGDELADPAQGHESGAEIRAPEADVCGLRIRAFDEIKLAAGR